MTPFIKPFDNPIYITRPLLPPLKEVYKKIKEIWESKWLTNFGEQHRTFEVELKKYLKVNYLSLFCNGTIALELALQALELTGEVITTPFTFPATSNSLYQKKLTPAYCDISLEDFNINPEEIENLITPKTSAIMPVHVFGNPCNIEKIEKIARNYNLKVIYDAAHCFGVEYKGKPIGTFGDINMFSFHATKIFHTIEGGALTYKDINLNEKLYLLKNFGIKSEEEVLLPGTNAKMNEIQAAIGLLNLQIVNEEIDKRKKLNKIYREKLKDIKGIKYLDENKDIKHNYQYFPILIDNEKFKLNRDQVYDEMKKFNVFTRKYFYPLCIDYGYYSYKDANCLPIAKKIVNEILCLPIYGELTKENVVKICDILLNLKT